MTLLQQLDQSRLSARVIFLVDGPMVLEVAEAGIDVSVLAAGRLRDPRTFARVVRALRHEIERDSVDVLISWGSKAQLYGGMAALGRPKPANVWWMLEVPRRTWLPMLATAIPARAIACSSHYVAGEQRRVLWPRRPTHVIHPGVREPRKIGDDELDSLRARLRIPADRFVIGIVGRMQPWKNHHLVVEAVEHLRRDKRNVHLVVVGATAHGRSPGYEEQLREQVRSCGIADRVAFVGHQTDVDPYFALFDVFVLGSGSEPFGLVVLEAMASGVPAIAVDLAGPSEILDHGRTGWLVPHPDAQLFADAIARLADDATSRARMSEAARAEYETRFTEPRMTREFERWVETLAPVEARVGRAAGGVVPG